MLNPGIKYASYNHPHKVLVSFMNGEVKEFDLTPYMDYPVFQPLKDEKFCRRLQVFNGTIAWDDDIDLDPDTVYSESKVIAALLIDITYNTI